MPFPTAKDIEFLCRWAIGVTKLARFGKWCNCQHNLILPELFICRHFTIIKIYLKFLQCFLVQSGNHFCETLSAFAGRHNLIQHILKTNFNIPLLHVGLLVCEVVMSTVSYRKGLGAASKMVSEVFFYISLVWIFKQTIFDYQNISDGGSGWMFTLSNMPDFFSFFLSAFSLLIIFPNTCTMWDVNIVCFCLTAVWIFFSTFVLRDSIEETCMTSV